MLITVTGSVLDASDKPLHVLITFAPQSSPFINSGGQTITKKNVYTKSNATDGTFSVGLEPGTYAVTFNTSPQTSFSIVVPPVGTTYTIDQLTNLPAPTPYVLSGNGSPEGMVVGIPGYIYTDILNDALYIKMSGTSSTGWLKFIQL